MLPCFVWKLCYWKYGGKSVSCFPEIFFWVTNQFVSESFVCNTNPVVPRCMRVT
ncbi:hypothetical protein POTOM_036835 [Populus tomentosa]|uniref:Uncharacterized protein n=1 Tax=Populus tomentosa TaxID=118781 RepID=A0A8X8CNH9_POPTO|nr:hypothetical protein POTOM_036835 [Populus tomentosa]